MTSEVTQAARKAACQHYGYDDEKDLAYWGNVSNHRDVERLAKAFAKFERETIARLTTQSGEGQGWIVGNGNGTKWQTWGSIGPEWTEDREQATRYARRVDAERVHAEDEDAWQIVPYSGEGRSGAGEDIKRDGYATAVRDLAKMDHVSEALKGVLFDCADLLDAKGEEVARLSCKGGREGAIGDIATERQRQIEAEGWTPEHDDKHYGGELSRAAACYAAHASAFQRVTVDLTAYRTADPARHDYGWPWSSSWWKPSTPRRDLVKAGALIVAEIERLDRAALRATDDAGGA